METEEIKMTKKDKIFWVVVILFALGLIIFAYYNTVVFKNFMIQAETTCDPFSETSRKCFVWVCDPADDDTCPNDELERVSYYKIINKKASNIALCEASEEKLGCNEELTCLEGESDCSYTYCDTANLAEGEICADVSQITSEPSEPEESTI
jgi:hypothetical protein